MAMILVGTPQTAAIGGAGAMTLTFNGANQPHAGDAIVIVDVSFNSGTVSSVPISTEAGATLVPSSKSANLALATNPSTQAWLLGTVATTGDKTVTVNVDQASEAVGYLIRPTNANGCAIDAPAVTDVDSTVTLVPVTANSFGVGIAVAQGVPTTPSDPSAWSTTAMAGNIEANVAYYHSDLGAATGKAISTLPGGNPAALTFFSLKENAAAAGSGGEFLPGRRAARRRPGRGPYSNGVYQRPRVDAFTSTSVAVGLATETDAALALLPIQILAVGMSTETDTAMALLVSTLAPLTDRIGSKQNRPGRGPYSLGRMFRPRLDAFPSPPPVTPAGTANETDTAFALLPVQIKAVGRADEADAALALNAGSGAPAGRSDESDTAFALARVQQRAVGQANETDTALALAGVQIRAAGRADESDTAIALTAGSAGSAGLANEADSALALQGKQARAVGLAAETEAAFALFGVTIRAAGLASESDSALALSPVQARAVGRANEADAAFALVAVQRLLAGIAAETDAALALAVIGAFPTVPSTFYMYVVPGNELTFVAP